MGIASPCIPSDYRRSQYVALNWAKWPLFIHALRVARSVLWLEADVTILRNPWELLLADAQQTATVGDAVRYQYEEPPCTVPVKIVSASAACNAKHIALPHPAELNCGQLLLNSIAFAAEVWESRHLSRMSNGEMSQQGYGNRLKGNYSHSGLPLAFFNHCWHAHHTAHAVDFCQIATYHATCEQSAAGKMALMNGTTKRTRTCAHPSSSVLTPIQLAAFAAWPPKGRAEPASTSKCGEGKCEELVRLADSFFIEQFRLAPPIRQPPAPSR